MASIDWSMVGLGALVGVGCRKQLKAAGRIVASTAASLAATAAAAAQQVADETKSQKSPEAEASEALLRRIDQHIADTFEEYTRPQAGQNGQAGNNQNPNG